jgi:sporulation protein YlmC with PRC-barrel domain
MTEFPRATRGNDGAVTRALSASSLLGRPVRMRGIRLGRPSDVLLDRATMRVVGLEVACGDDVRRFLPLAAARVHDDEIAVRSALHLLEGDDLAFYRRRGRLLSAMRGRVVTLAGRPVGVLRDVLLDADGAVTLLEVETRDGRDPVRTQVPLDSTVAIADSPATAA